MDQIIKTIMEGLIQGGKHVQEINKVIPVKGERYTLPLGGRDIDIVFYKAEEENRPLMIGLHGGGFVNGGSAIDDNQWCALKETLNVNIASVNYRMAPENKWPAAIYDAYESAVYLKDHAEEFGFAKDCIIIMGNSAGGNIAATTCIYAKQKGADLFNGQILFYPYLDLASDPMSKGGSGIFSGPSLAAMNALYADEENYSNSMLSPVCADPEELEDLPPAIFCLGGADALCPEAVRYSEMLKEVGVPVCLKIAEGMPHAFIENNYYDEIPEPMRDELTMRILEDGSMAAATTEALDFVRENFGIFN